MLAVIRRYEPVAPAVARSFLAARDRVEAILQDLPGLHAALLLRTRDGLALVAIGEEEWCLAEAGRRFRAWGDGHVAGFQSADEAAISVGEVISASGVLAATLGSDRADHFEER